MRKFLVFAFLLISFNRVSFAANTVASSRVTLTAAPASAPYGTVIALVAAVADQNGNPVSNGRVTFFAGNATLGAAQVVSSASAGNAVGTAALHVILASLGANDITATYAGSGPGSSSAPVPVFVTGQYPSATTLTRTGSGGNYTLTGTVLATGPAAPTGSIAFTDATTGLEVGTATINPSTLTQTFTPGTPATGLTAPIVAAFADVNAEGIPDLVTGNTEGLFVQLGNANGTFQPPVKVSTAGVSSQAYFGMLAGASIVFGDFNGDGNLDIAFLACANSSSTCSVSVLLGNGDGSFQPGRDYDQSSVLSGIAVGDFNGDGILDLAVANFSSGTVDLLIGNGDGTFQQPATTPLPGANSIAAADLTGNGKLDLVVAQGDAEAADVLPKDGNGIILLPISIATGSNLGPLPLPRPHSIGKLDALPPESAISVLLGNGDGTFQPAQSYANGSNPGAVTLADLRGAGKLDIVHLDSNNAVGVLLSNGNGTFQAATVVYTAAAPSNLQSIAVVDVNGDGLPDLEIADSGSNVIAVLTGNGDGTFQSPVFYPAGGTPTGIAVADLNHDGMPEIAAANRTGTSVGILLNQVTESATLSNALIAGTATHLVTGAYSGDASFASGTSNSVKLAADLVTPTMQLTVQPGSPIPWGQQLSVVITLGSSDAWLPLPTGTVSYSIDKGASQSASLTAGTLTAVISPLKTGSHSIAVQYGGDAYYAALPAQTLAVTVIQATPTLSWATPAAITFGTTLSAAQLDATSAIPGTFAYSPATGILLTAGPQTLAVTFTPADKTDYTVATATVVLTVNPATPALSWTTPAAITYGTALSTAQLDATSKLAGTLVYSPSAGTVPGAGVQTLSVAFKPTDTVDYAAATATVQLTVKQAQPTVAWSTPAAISYGTPLGAVQLDASASVPGTLTYSPAAGTVLTAGSQTLSVLFTPTDCVDYASATDQVKLSVTAAKPSISWTTPSPIAYGTPLSTAQLNAASPVPGSFVYTPAAGTVLNPGAHTLSVTFNPTDTVDYTTTTTTALLLVGPEILSQPGSQTVVVGRTATFRVSATSPIALTYAWQYLSGTSWLPFTQGTGYNTSGLSFVTTSANNGLQLRALVTDANNLSAASNVATLTLSLAITTQPSNQTVSCGASATFTVVAAGAAPFTYQWQYLSGSTWLPYAAGTGAQTATLTTAPTTGASDGMQVNVVVTDANGFTVTSTAANLRVAPGITLQPLSQSAADGSNVVFTVTAAGATTLYYNWQYLSGDTWTPFTAAAGTGFKTSTFTTSPITAASNGLQVRVVVNDSRDLTIISNTATLTVLPGILTQPQHQTIAANMTATFSVVAGAPTQLTYQWQYQSGTSWLPFTAGTGYNTPTLITNNMSVAYDNYQIRVFITDADGNTVISKTVVLTVIL